MEKRFSARAWGATCATLAVVSSAAGVLTGPGLVAAPISQYALAASLILAGSLFIGTLLFFVAAYPLAWVKDFRRKGHSALGAVSLSFSLLCLAVTLVYLAATHADATNAVMGSRYFHWFAYFCQACALLAFVGEKWTSYKNGALGKPVMTYDSAGRPVASTRQVGVSPMSVAAQLVSLLLLAWVVLR